MDREIQARCDLSERDGEERPVGAHNTDEPADIAKLLKDKTGKTWYLQIPDAVRRGERNRLHDSCLRFPLHASGSKMLSGDRSAVNVAIDVNGRTVKFTSTHLHPDSSSFRKTEVGELTSWEHGMAEQRIVAGDFNAGHTTSEMSDDEGDIL